MLEGRLMHEQSSGRLMAVILLLAGLAFLVVEALLAEWLSGRPARVKENP